MSINREQINTAYRKLKSYIYYDKTDLRLRKRLAEFECAADFETKLEAVQVVVNSSRPALHKDFEEWLQKIDFRIVPKKIKWGSKGSDFDESANGKFITNVTSTAQIEIEKVNYFFDGPIELHLIAVLWIMEEGRFLDAQLGHECCGSRLVASLHEDSDNSSGLFLKYHEQYSKWRDTGIRKAKQTLIEDRSNVAILGLDIQEYFYRIRLDFNAVGDAINQAKLEASNGDDIPVKRNLLRCIDKMGRTYRKMIEPYLELTHTGLTELDSGLPIGLCSSLVLANWYLKDFDNLVRKSVRPSYYGRYVDDILIVVPAARDPEKVDGSPVSAFVDEILVKTGILREPEDHRYELADRNGLYLQQEKCILQYFDAKHSIAGLDKFQKKLEQNGSDFVLMPVDEADNSMEDVAYEILYEGSVNKFRSIKGMAENRYELAKHLARQTILHLLTDDRPDPIVSLGLRKFFKGKNSIEYHDLWERVFTFFAISDDPKAANAFDRHLQAEMKRVRCADDVVTNHLVEDLKHHLKLSKAMAMALCEDDWGFAEIIPGYDIEVLRNSNLIRHHFVRKPLLNYTKFTGPLTTRTVARKVHVDRRKLELTPRYLNFDECLLLASSRDVLLNKMTPYQWATDIYEFANRCVVDGVEWTPAKDTEIDDDAQI
jgi:hypothetical protein